MSNRKKWAVVWGSWVAYFAVAETIALASNENDAPLSYHLRHVLGIKRGAAHRIGGEIAYSVAMVWLIDHLYKEVKNAL